jgi:glycosyltransferase involved in cell wall biosynthesis
MTPPVGTRVSVVVPVFNVGDYVDECLRSIRRQTHCNIEIVVVDDASTDNSMTVVAQHMGTDDRIRLVRHAANLGLSEARNSGIDAATGDYIIFVDSDDVVDDRLVERCLDAALGEGLDIVVFDHVVFAGQVPVGCPGESGDTGIRQFTPADPEYFQLPYFAWLKFIRRGFLVTHDLRFLVGHNYEDHLFHWQLGLARAVIGQIADPLYFYRLRTGSITATGNRSFADQIEMYRLIALILRPLCVEPRVHDVLKQRAAAAFWFIYFNATEEHRPRLAEMIRGVIVEAMVDLPKCRAVPVRQRLFFALLLRPTWLRRAMLAAVRHGRAARRYRQHCGATQSRPAQHDPAAAAPRPDRVLQVVGTMDRAGAETMIMNLYRHIDRTAIQFDFLYFTDRTCDFDSEIASLGGRIFRVPARGQFRTWHRMWFMTRLLRVDRAFVAVHCHNLLGSGLHVLAAQLAGIPVRIVHSHNTSNGGEVSLVQALYGWTSRALIGFSATRLVSCGHAAGDYLFPSRTDVTIMPNAIDLRRFAMRPVAHDQVADAGGTDRPHGLRIVQVGRLETVKNHVFGLAIAGCLRDHEIRFTLSIIGQGELHQEIAAEIDRLGLSRHVRMMGPRADVAAIMADADAMIMPSLHEGFPVVLVEAQASGLPSFVSDRVSSEVDLGLGLVHFLSLARASDWAERLCAIAVAEKMPDMQRISMMTAKGFDVASSVDTLMNLYKTCSAPQS